jgi:hypothetical protein
METYHSTPKSDSGETEGQGFDLMGWGSNKHYVIGSTTHSNIPMPHDRTGRRQ